MEISEIILLAQEYEQQLPPAPTPLTLPEGRQIAGWIDHTLLKPEATAAQVRTLCQEAMQYHFASVCINPVYIPLACGLMKDAPSHFSVVGFLLGAVLPEIKVYKPCLHQGGCFRDDMVITLALKLAFGLIMNDVQQSLKLPITKCYYESHLGDGFLTRRENPGVPDLCRWGGFRKDVHRPWHRCGS
jgi:hypothetical protein